MSIAENAKIPKFKYIYLNLHNIYKIVNLFTDGSYYRQLNDLKKCVKMEL